MRRSRIDKDVALLKYAGVRWVRVGMPAVLPLPVDQDYYLNRLHDGGIDILFCVSSYSLPSDSNGFQRSLARTVRAYPFIRAWEGGNEPNLNSYWKDDPQNYVPTQKLIYEAIKAVDASKIVTCAGLSEWKVEPFLDMIVRQNADKWMDAFAFHPYGATPNQVMSRLFSARSRLQGSAIYSKPIWITEIGFQTAKGWHTSGHVADEAAKADALEQTFAMLAPFTQGPIFWYTFQEESGPVMGYGLINRSPSREQPDVDPPVTFSAAFERYRSMSGAIADKSVDLASILAVR